VALGGGQNPEFEPWGFEWVFSGCKYHRIVEVDIMSEYQDWVFIEEDVTGFDVINLVMDHPDCWYCPPNEYPPLMPCWPE
jgi:hypothetical protein